MSLHEASSKREKNLTVKIVHIPGAFQIINKNVKGVHPWIQHVLLTYGPAITG